MAQLNLIWAQEKLTSILELKNVYPFSFCFCFAGWSFLYDRITLHLAENQVHFSPAPDLARAGESLGAGADLSRRWLVAGCPCNVCTFSSRLEKHIHLCWCKRKIQKAETEQILFQKILLCWSSWTVKTVTPAGSRIPESPSSCSWPPASSKPNLSSR